MRKGSFIVLTSVLLVLVLSACTTSPKEETPEQDQNTQSEEQGSATSPASDDPETDEADSEETDSTVTTTDWTHMSLGEIENASEIVTVAHFWEFLAEGKSDEAIAMLDADAATKSAWSTNFATIQELEVDSIGPVRMAEWTDTRQIFKIHLQVQVTPEGEQMGWENGENERWVTLQKNGTNWQVHELANNP